MGHAASGSPEASGEIIVHDQEGAKVVLRLLHAVQGLFGKVPS